MITYRRGHAAVNVKVYNWPKAENLDKLFERIGLGGETFFEILSAAIDIYSIYFWNEGVQQIAKLCGFNEVYSEGRSDGWAVPIPYVTEEDDHTKFLEFQTFVDDVIDNADNDLTAGLINEYLVQEEMFLMERSVTLRSILAWQPLN